jgi:hypothetical protein
MTPPGGGLYKFANPVVTHSLKAAWFQPLIACEVTKNYFFKVCFFKFVNLYRYSAGCVLRAYRGGGCENRAQRGRARARGGGGGGGGRGVDPRWGLYKLNPELTTRSLERHLVW